MGWINTKQKLLLVYYGILPCVIHTHILCALYTGLLCPCVMCILILSTKLGPKKNPKMVRILHSKIWYLLFWSIRCYRTKFFFNFYCYSVTLVCIFSPSLDPTPANPTSLPHLHPPPWFCPCVFITIKGATMLL